MVKSINILVEQGVLTKEAAARLKGAWIRNCDELYSRIRACEFSDNPHSMILAMERELGLKEGALPGFKKYIEEYVSPEAVSAEKPKQYPLGAKFEKK